MRIVESISDSVNYGMTNVDHVVKKIVSNPSAVKKVLQIATKTFAAFDLYSTGKIQDREITHLMKGTIDLIGFYTSYKHIMYWMNLFSKESIDQEALKQSIENSLCGVNKQSKISASQKKLASKVFATVMVQEIYHSKTEVLNVIKLTLQKEGYSAEKAEQVAKRILVSQKSRPRIELFYMACFTVADIGSSILTLQKWHLLTLSKVAANIGSQSRIFLFVIDLGADMVLGSVASAGLILVIGELSHRAILHGMEYYSVNGKEKEVAYQKLSKDLMEILTNALDLAATASPLIFTLSPPTLVALALISKGTGLVYYLAK